MASQRDGGIPWCDETWNPIRGCSRVSEGCRNCYAERAAIRQVGSGHAGLVRSTPSGPRWTGDVRLINEVIDLPWRWTRPRRIFVNSMSDLFHEKVEDTWIDQIVGVIAGAPQHTFQVLTKRPERMRAWVQDRVLLGWDGLDGRRVPTVYETSGFPPKNVHLGVSVEDQATADERIPLLLQTPAAVRWVSYEPALGPVDFTHLTLLKEEGLSPGAWLNALTGHVAGPDDVLDARLDWIVVGGESGPGARPFDLAWARSTIAQCRAAGVPVFVKQLGARPQGYREITDGGEIALSVPLTDRKGGDWTEWPEDLRVREFPR